MTNERLNDLKNAVKDCIKIKDCNHQCRNCKPIKKYNIKDEEWKDFINALVDAISEKGVYFAEESKYI